VHRTPDRQHPAARLLLLLLLLVVVLGDAATAAAVTFLCVISGAVRPCVTAV